MVIQFPGSTNGYTNSLRETSRQIPVSDDQYDRILQSVFSAVEEEGAVPFAKGQQVVEKMMSTNMTKMVNQVIATGTGAAVMAAALFLVVSVNTETRGGGQSIIIPDNDIPLTGWENMEILDTMPDYQVELAPLPENGRLPTLKSFYVEDGYIHLYLQGVEDEVVWGRIYGLTPEGERLYPMRMDKEAGMLQFKIPDHRLEIYVEVVEGTPTQMELDPLPREY